MEDLVYQIDNWSIVKLLGGFAAILALFGKIIYKRLKFIWDKSAKKELEQIKSELQKSNSTLNNLQSSYLSHIEKFQDKKIEASTVLWNSVIEIKENIPSSLALILSIYPSSDLTNEILDQENRYGESMGQRLAMINEGDMMKIMPPATKIESYRPFLNIELYRLFKLYVAVIGRVTFIVVNNYKNGNLNGWKNDDHLIQILKQALTKEELGYIKTQQIGSFDNLVHLLQIKIENEIQKTLSGKDFSKDTIDQLKELEKLSSTAKVK
jgi:DNA-directed RNA polymerase subunit F